MKAHDILRSTALRHVGYEPRFVSLMALTAKEADEYGYKRLQRIPQKISSYFYRDKILKAYVSTHAKDWRDNYYLLVTTDKTVFCVEY